VRELYEETGIRADAGPVFTAVDAFDGAAGPDARAHYVLIAVLCHWRAGEPQAGDDALEARWYDLGGLERAGLAMSFGVASVARQAFAIWQDGPTRPDVPK
jgi:ADP-ribose pyrophosphatase YjhB (NUDIX family)